MNRYRMVDVAGAVASREAEQRRTLRSMKVRATGLLVLAAAVLASTYLVSSGGDGWLGFVRAGAEAAMVGGLADWFAVTALFRRPLGLPIPHTALIPRRKDDLGRTLATFMQENFLAPDVVVTRLRGMAIVSRAGNWLAEPDHAHAVTVEIADLVHGLLDEVRRDDIATVVSNAARGHLAEMSYASLAGRVLAGFVEDGSHEALVDIGIRQLRRWLVTNEELAVTTMHRPVPGFIPRFLTRPVIDETYQRILDIVVEVQDHPRHPLRRSVDRLLLDYADDLRKDPPTSAAFDDLVRTALLHPETAAAMTELLDRLLSLLRDLADEPEGALRAEVRARLIDVGTRVRDDAEFAARLGGVLERFVVHVTQTYADVFIRFITDTVADWDAAEATRRIELNVGRDLQFIRINGTVVGAAAGLAIHAVTLSL